MSQTSTPAAAAAAASDAGVPGVPAVPAAAAAAAAPAAAAAAGAAAGAPAAAAGAAAAAYATAVAAGFPGARLVYNKDKRGVAWLLPASPASAKLLLGGHGSLLLPVKEAGAVLPAPMVAAAAAALRAKEASTPCVLAQRRRAQLSNLRTWSKSVLQATLKHTVHGPKKFQGGWGKKRVMDAFLRLPASDWKLAMTFLSEKGGALEAEMRAKAKRLEEERKRQYEAVRKATAARHAELLGHARRARLQRQRAAAKKRKHPWMQEEGAAAKKAKGGHAAAAAPTSGLAASLARVRRERAAAAAKKKAKKRKQEAAPDAAAAAPASASDDDDPEAVVCTGHKTLEERLRQGAQAAASVDDDDEEA